jgi:hypothetical protein
LTREQEEMMGSWGYRRVTERANIRRLKDRYPQVRQHGKRFWPINSEPFTRARGEAIEEERSPVF